MSDVLKLESRPEGLLVETESYIYMIAGGPEPEFMFALALRQAA